MNRPAFIDSKVVNISIDTSGHCQARCSNCVWPELTPTRHVMSLETFGQVLDRFDGYAFSKFSFNSINEPFSDKTVLDKLEMFIERGCRTQVLFFSSNWLIPKPDALDWAAELFARALSSGCAERVSVNATVSGIDAESYDVLQSGRDLTFATSRYKPLDFAKAIDNPARLIRRLSEITPPRARLQVYLKAYGDLFDAAAYEAFWSRELDARNIDPAWRRAHVSAKVNHGFTSFARSEATGEGARRCTMGWLEDRIVIAPSGQVGLCCHEGAHKVQVGSLIDADMQTLAEGSGYTEHLRMVRGESAPPAGHICHACEFYTAPPSTSV